MSIPKEFKHVPTFSEFYQVKDAVQKMYLNNEGANSLCRIMWVISNYHTSITYSPIIVNFASLLLIYTSEKETYEVLTKMIRSSLCETSIFSKFFTFDQEEFDYLIESRMKKSENNK